MAKTYIGYDEGGREFDVRAEIQGYLDKIAKLENEVTKLLGEVSDLKKKLAEKPKVKEVKKNEW